MKKKLLLLGLSTGGPSHIKKILSSFKTLNSHIIIAQHMKQEVIPFFINDMSEQFAYNVTSIPSTLQSEYKVAFCEESCEIESCSSERVSVKPTKEVAYYTPDINLLFHSATKLCDKYDVCAILMTGIGSDGAEGLKALRESGAMTIAESESSAPVFGMPRIAQEIGAAQKVLSIDEIVTYLKRENYVLD